ncbi:hypothetical protein KUV28_21455 [Ferrimonas balearica]|nr:hypothetical protein [Ferrimonas balearica]
MEMRGTTKGPKRPDKARNKKNQPSSLRHCVRRGAIAFSIKCLQILDIWQNKQMISNTKGNVLFIIMIAVALFAALSYAVSNGMRGGGDIVTDKQADIITSEIITYGAAVKEAWAYLINQGCSETEISFQSPEWDSQALYENLNSPSDKSCHIFSENGGGVKWRTWNRLTHDSNYGPVAFKTGDMGGAHAVRGWGTDDRHDLFMKLGASRPDLKNFQNALSVCKSINERSNVPSNPTGFEKLFGVYSGLANYRYTGAFNDSTSPIGSPNVLNSKNAFCATTGNTSSFVIIFPIYLR